MVNAALSGRRQACRHASICTGPASRECGDLPDGRIRRRPGAPPAARRPAEPTRSRRPAWPASRPAAVAPALRAPARACAARGERDPARGRPPAEPRGCAGGPKRRRDRCRAVPAGLRPALLLLSRRRECRDLSGRLAPLRRRLRHADRAGRGRRPARERNRNRRAISGRRPRFLLRAAA